MSARRHAASLSALGTAYVTAVGAVGCAVFAWAAASIFRDGLLTNRTWLIFTALTFASARMTVKIPSVDARFSVTELFAFAGILLFGPATGAITPTLDTLIYSWRQRLTLRQALFNFGNLALAAFVSGTLFFVIADVPPLAAHSAPTEVLVLPLAVMAAVYFAINTGLVVVAIGFQTHQRPFQIWQSQFASLGPAYAAGASGALLLVMAVQQVQVGMLALLLPTVVVSYLMVRSSFGRLEDAQQYATRLNGLYFSTVETLATAIDAKDHTTHDHVRRVQQGAMALARRVGITDETLLKAVEAASLLHDTGKIAVPEHILNKPGRLTPAEFEKMKLHAPIGAEILSSIDFPYPVVPIVRHHHENWDGTGYPDGLRGTDIPIGARILSVVDCFDALTSHRPYRGRLSDEDALQILRDRRGTMYDPDVVDAFVASYTEIMPPAEQTVHPAARAVGLARGLRSAEPPPEVAPARESGALEQLGAFASLSRAVTGEAGIADFGTLVWLLIRDVVPCSSLALFVPDERTDAMVARYANGEHAATLRTLRYGMSRGAIGWTAVNRRMIVNGEAALGAEGRDATSLPHWVCTLPLVHEGAVVAVLALYAREAAPFADGQAHVLELLAPRLAATVAHVNTIHAAGDPVAGVPARAELHVVARAAHS